MSKVYSFTKTGTAHASTRVVWDLVAHGETWPMWSPIQGFSLEAPGRQGGESEGAIRVFRISIGKSREQVTEVKPGRLFSYTLLSGLPVRNHLATITIAPFGNETSVSWFERFEATIGGTGAPMAAAMSMFIGRCLSGLLRHAGDQ